MTDLNTIEERLARLEKRIAWLGHRIAEWKERDVGLGVPPEARVVPEKEAELLLPRMFCEHCDTPLLPFTENRPQQGHTTECEECQGVIHKNCSDRPHRVVTCEACGIKGTSKELVQHWEEMKP